MHTPADAVAARRQRCRCKETAFRSAKCNCRSKKGNARTVSGIQRAPTRIARLRQILPQGDELPASSQVVCGGAAELSRSAAAAGGVRDLLPIRTERRVVRADAGALDAKDRKSTRLNSSHTVISYAVFCL